MDQSTEPAEPITAAAPPVPVDRSSFSHGMTWAIVISGLSMLIAPLNHDGYMLVIAVPLYVGAAIIVPLGALLLRRRAFARGAFRILPISLILWLIVLFYAV